MSGPKLKYSDVLTLAKSGDDVERKRGWELYQAWIKASPTLSVNDRLTEMERSILAQIFAQKGFKTGR